ncbi:MAG TPA: YidC/Oxa1 family membrane protein insertase [Acidimicrobiales bacterium]|nr:YidC/Oxa1 family membrane protein insertase [Acidimicrobiales bacterium]
MILSSIITSIISPFADIFGQVLAFFYSFTHSFGLSIVLLTLTVMVVVFPLTRAGTRSMMRMQILAPELKKIQQKYKTQPGMSTEERQANRTQLNEEMMALYRENGVNPTGGCLPMFLQFPIFIVLYDVIRGMTRTVTVGKGSHLHQILSPQYIPTNSSLYHAVKASHGVLGFLGLNLADSVRTTGLSWSGKVPYIAVILIAVVLQYVSMWQITTRNPAAQQANPQMQAIQKFMPLIFVIFYIVLPAGVGVYFIVSSLFRVGQQEYMYKHDPKVQESIAQIRKMRAAIDVKAKAAAEKSGATSGGRAPAAATDGARKSFRERLRDARAGLTGELPTAPGGGDGQQQVARNQNGKASRNGAPGSSGGTRGGSRSGAAARTNGNGNGSKGSQNRQPASAGSSRNRARDKRSRRP